MYRLSSGDAVDLPLRYCGPGPALLSLSSAHPAFCSGRSFNRACGQNNIVKPARPVISSVMHSEAGEGLHIDTAVVVAEKE